MRAWFLVLLAGSFLSPLSPLTARQNTSQAQTPPLGQRPRAAPQPGRSVTIEVVVTDHSGKPAPGLQQQDFTILDDNQPQTIKSFHAVDGTAQPPRIPPQALLVFDAVNSTAQLAGYAQEQMERYLRQNGGQLPIPVSLVFFTESTLDRTAATRDGNALANYLSSRQAGRRAIGRTAQGFYGGEEQVQISLSGLQDLASSEATKPGRKLLIWISPGWPLLNGPYVQISSKGQSELFQLIVQVNTQLEQGRVTLYDVNPIGTSEGLLRTFYYQSFVKGVTSAKNFQDGDVALQVFAVQSGGRVLEETNDVGKSIADCLEDAKVYYTLTFDSPRADHPDEYHKLEVKIDKHGLTARTRTGYYAQP